MDIIEKSQSILRMEQLYFQKLLYEKTKDNTAEDNIDFDVKYDNLDDDIIKVSLFFFLQDKRAKIEICLIGIFQIEDSGMQSNLKNEIIHTNTVSIMFPYLRSQLTLLTSQPNIEPIILPPLNINSLLEDLNRSKKAIE